VTKWRKWESNLPFPCGNEGTSCQATVVDPQAQIARHMAINLVYNVHRALTRFPVTSVCCWLNSTDILHWIRDSIEYHQFIANQVGKIREHAVKEWRHVPTAHNLADLGSPGRSVVESAL